MILDSGDNKKLAIIPLSFIISKFLALKFSIALLFLIELSVIVFVVFSAVILIVSVGGP